MSHPTEEKIIMYDSPEAAKQVTVTGWVSSDGRFYGSDEHLARWAGSTHNKCECGNIVKKSWLKCESCREKMDDDKFLSLPFKEWNGSDVVCTKDCDKYLFSASDVLYYMTEEFDEPLQELDLIICEDEPLQTVGEDFWLDGMPDDAELPDALLKALKNLNNVIESLPPQIYYPSKIRTKVKLSDFS
jgi:hypothetical protein